MQVQATSPKGAGQGPEKGGAVEKLGENQLSDRQEGQKGHLILF